jgi:hypothetical protein
MMIGRTAALHIALPLFIGGMTYITWRSDSLLMFSWFEYLGLGEVVSDWRSFAAPIKRSLPDWFIFSLPNGLWTYSFMVAMTVLWGTESSNFKWLYLFLAPICSVGAEAGQLIGLVPGTFSVEDFGCCLIACICGYFINRVLINQQRSIHVYQ